MILLVDLWYMFLGLFSGFSCLGFVFLADV